MSELSEEQERMVINALAQKAISETTSPEELRFFLFQVFQNTMKFRHEDLKSNYEPTLFSIFAATLRVHEECIIRLYPKSL